MKPQEKLKLMAVLAMTYHDRNVPRESMEFLIDELSDIDTDILALSLKAYINGPDCAFFPRPGQIRAEANRIQNAAQRLPTAEQAWVEATSKTRRFVTKRCEEFKSLADTAFKTSGAASYFEVLKKIDSHVGQCAMCTDGYEDDQFSHPLIEKIARDLNWPHMETDNPAADRARFIDAYNKAVKTHQDLQGLPPAVRDGINALADRLKSPAIAAGRGGESTPIAELLPGGENDDRKAAFDREERDSVWAR